MPELTDCSYSRDEFIALIRNYYSFLMTMYLPEDAVIYPPVEGWPTISSENFRDMNKTPEVISLLRHLPYIRVPSTNPLEQAQGAPWCYFADWQDVGALLERNLDGKSLKLISEGPDICDNVPAHVIGLTDGGRENPIFLLDTELGVVYWPDCPGEISNNPSYNNVQIFDDPYEWAPDDEADWRDNASRWTMKGFFEVLKDQFLNLNFIATSTTDVIDVYSTPNSKSDGSIERLQNIYRQHGWPDAENFRKQECLEALENAMEQQSLMVV
ncbi:hypothetical protein CMEL01_02889 [Colletotrichum melonis]|uniref:Alpha beta hydrolase fold protein n=1 Tax=Colletotrichum melonis TaxID=1209925 RepID=A0AAI9UK04_9PEZI|nr:hypothetical protein CMEL01_02889 [Colletotrichum melonis]